MKNIFTKTKQIGDFGEDAAAKYLKKNGYNILERNYRASYNEIDIIAEDKSFIVFTEVKSRTANKGSPSRFGRPARAVDQGKKRHTVSAARTYLHSNPTDKQVRMDVIEVYLEKDADGNRKVTDIIHIRNAYGVQK
ncbi:MAG: YraN family protein [Clostridia bacterium]|nr:YraN family protein [Clostridia bacterium]